MTTGTTEPDLAGFRRLARQHRVIPVIRRLLADGLTPVGLYRALAQDRPGTFVLESAEGGQSWSRWSFVGVRSAATLTAVDGEACWQGKPPAGLPSGGDPAAALRASVDLLRTARLPGLPPLTGGLVGYLSYDFVRRLESLPTEAPDELDVPELAFLLATDLAALDHVEGTVWLIANAVNWDGSDERVDEAHADAERRLDAMVADLVSATATSVASVQVTSAPAPSRRTSSADFCLAASAVKAEIASGEAFQVVLSQRFAAPCPASALDVYRVLRATNPSPYMYLLRMDGFDVVGSSPESLVSVRAGQARMHPIAGTRRRGDDPQEDADLAAELLADPKERAEHLMLVDLGRNDLGRVCVPGTVDVPDFMKVERFSHVMHLVSTVTGQLAEGRTGLDVLLACFPAGTLTGAPKPRAMSIIERLEPARRGLYGGCVGYADFAGDIDAAIAIRTALIKDGVAIVQAGAGIVADSDPAAEQAECEAKAAAVLSAVAVAATLRELS